MELFSLQLGFWQHTRNRNLPNPEDGLFPTTDPGGHGWPSGHRMAGWPSEGRLAMYVTLAIPYLVMHASGSKCSLSNPAIHAFWAKMPRKHASR